MLASLVDQPERIKRLFVSPTNRVNAVGIYQVQLHINGMLQSVIVDDYIPVEKESGKPAFCRSENQEIWAIILEKAWAKLNVTYAKSSSCVPNFASIHLTGVPAEYFPHDSPKLDPDKLWQTLDDSLASSHSLIANGSLSVSDEKIVGKHTWGEMKARAMRANYETSIEFKMYSEDQKAIVRRLITLEASKTEGCIQEKGIANKHAYPVLGLVQFKADGYEEPVRLVKLSNTPGAEGQWNGDWSKDSQLWTRELTSQYLNTLKENEFFMPFADYLKWFKGTMVNLDQHRETYTIPNIGVDMNKEQDMFLKFKLKEPIDCGKEVFTIICE